MSATTSSPPPYSRNPSASVEQVDRHARRAARRRGRPGTPRAPGRRSRLGMIRCWMSITEIAGISASSAATGVRHPRIVVDDHAPATSMAGRELDGRIHRARSARRTRGIAPEQQPPEHRDVVAVADLRAAAWAPRPRAEQRLLRGHAGDDDGHEAPDGEPDDEGDDDREGLHPANPTLGARQPGEVSR